MKTNAPVSVRSIDTYDEQKITEILREQMNTLGYDNAFFEKKKVVIKPNLVMKKAPDAAATTHPVVLSALLTVLGERGVSPIIAESPGGLFNRQRLEGVYRMCGIAEVAERHHVELSYDTEAVFVPFPNGKTVKTFHVIRPIAEADVVIDLCKLKSHGLTKMSAAIKNFFGVIPGVEKFEMHATFPDYKDFGSMICDLCQMLYEQKEIIAITDAIIGMEGDGPTAGTPRKIGALLMSANPFASDIVGETLLGFENTVPIVREAVSRGLCPADISGVTLLGDDIRPLCISDFKEPETAENGADFSCPVRKPFPIYARVAENVSHLVLSIPSSLSKSMAKKLPRYAMQIVSVAIAVRSFVRLGQSKSRKISSSKSQADSKHQKGDYI